MRAGYRFLRSQPTLFANTIQASFAQLTVGVLTALMPAYARAVFEAGALGWEAVYGLIESSVGIGNLVGGFAIGLVGARLSKGQMISGSYLVWGLLTTAFALSGNLGMVLGLALGSGIANMGFIIPSQALFQELTPAALMGRVVGFRFALVFGAMAIAMARRRRADPGHGRDRGHRPVRAGQRGRRHRRLPRAGDPRRMTWVHFGRAAFDRGPSADSQE